MQQEDIKKLYIETSVSQINEVLGKIPTLEQNLSDKKTIEPFYILFHSLATKSFVTGYEKIGNFCKAWEKQLKDILDQTSLLTREDFANIHESIIKLQTAIGKIQNGEEEQI